MAVYARVDEKYDRRLLFHKRNNIYNVSLM